MRGGDGGVCDREGLCRTDLQKFRQCSDSDIIKRYESNDIVLSDEMNRCAALYNPRIEKIYNPENERYLQEGDIYTHDAVIVGHAR